VELAKAILRKVESDFTTPSNPDHKVTVQFNPETLKVTYANQISTPNAPRNQGGTPAQQFVGAGSTKLSLQLWFDVTAQQASGSEERDVRKLTEKVAFFITPDEKNGNIIPAIQFVWGSFLFAGLMESLEESLEFFSAEGIPLRASMTLGLTRQKITQFTFEKDATTQLAGTPNAPRELKAAPAGKTLPGMAAAQGKGDNWQDIAAANNIENPRLLQPGQLIDMDARLPQPPFGSARF
jgi:Contractile injection system tube protein